MENVGKCIIPQQTIEFFVEDKKGYKHKCSGIFTGTLENLGLVLKGTDFAPHYLGIEVKLNAPQISVTFSKEEEQYIKKIEALEKELKELRIEIQDSILRK